MKRIEWVDTFRSLSMLFVFYHHLSLALTGNIDLFYKFNVFAEIFVVLAGFVVGAYLIENKSPIKLFRRGLLIIFTYLTISLLATLIAGTSGLLKESIQDAVINVILLNRDVTTIGILRFYGLIFMLSPLIYFGWRKSKTGLILTSVLLFLGSIAIDKILIIDNYNFFYRKTLLNLLEWQLFFIFGILSGHWYSRNAAFTLNLIKTHRYQLIIISTILFLLQFHFSPSAPIEKFPYSLERFFYLLSTLPATIALLIGAHKFIKNLGALNYVNYVGKNSLSAFVLSDFLYVPVKLLYTKEQLTPGVFMGNMIAIIFALLTPILLYIFNSLLSRLISSHTLLKQGIVSNKK